MIYCLSLEVVIEINRQVSCGTVINRGNLEGALARPVQAVFGAEMYPSVPEKAVALLHGVANAHGFKDGNKRTAWTCCMTFLRLHDLSLAPQDHVVAGKFVIDVMQGHVSMGDAAEWLVDRLDA